MSQSHRACFPLANANIPLFTLFPYPDAQSTALTTAPGPAEQCPVQFRGTGWNCFHQGGRSSYFLVQTIFLPPSNPQSPELRAVPRGTLSCQPLLSQKPSVSVLAPSGEWEKCPDRLNSGYSDKLLEQSLAQVLYFPLDALFQPY